MKCLVVQTSVICHVLCGSTIAFSNWVRISSWRASKWDCQSNTYQQFGVWYLMCDCLNLILSLCSQNVHTRCFFSILMNCCCCSSVSPHFLVTRTRFVKLQTRFSPDNLSFGIPIWWLYKSPLFTMFSLYVVKAPTSTPDRSPLISFCSSGLPLLGGKHFGSLHSSLWFLTLPCFVYSKSDVCRFFNPIASWFYEKKTPFLGPHNLDGQRKCGFRGVPYIPSSQVAECYAVYY